MTHPDMVVLLILLASSCKKLEGVLGTLAKRTSRECIIHKRRDHLLVGACMNLAMLRTKEIENRPGATTYMSSTI